MIPRIIRRVYLIARRAYQLHKKISSSLLDPMTPIPTLVPFLSLMPTVIVFVDGLVPLFQNTCRCDNNEGVREPIPKLPPSVNGGRQAGKQCCMRSD